MQEVEAVAMWLPCLLVLLTSSTLSPVEGGELSDTGGLVTAWLILLPSVRRCDGCDQ